ncbi:Ku protein [Legionella taurinensis]|uniref:Non-homologous end joining protein Ku n=1 Tax=Legionella taurinensis TaxID=70611 RepID=A0A3A5LDD1_9GAMM|nr:Ku protein [Legionella taurinensis]MDX1838376.1 Ku protein [Legionella taurinensis]PUT39136.1 Ku protein [Legionella taurinensis]PUT39761.1 Ku protein [Legionella taurinensis]PUT43592.1 Ku protein [Legionella taurinensis]PUT45248.1 Ku protein [Legionella taurinensis]
MPRPVWKGDISFGLVAIPVSLVQVEEKQDIHFHLVDSRDHSRIRYERVNSETGKEVPWNEIVKAYEYDKDSYIVLDEDDFKKASPDAYKSIDIEEFVNLKDIDYLFFDKPYYILPESKNKKAYVLLREALKKSNKVGVAKIIIRTREYLSLILPHDKALILYIIRFQQEIREEEDFNFPTNDLKAYKINDKEIKMAKDLISEMSTPWEPEKYHDDYRDALIAWIDKKMQGITSAKPAKKAKKTTSDDVIDFMELLKQSMDKKGKGKSDKQESSKTVKKARKSSSK